MTEISMEKNKKKKKTSTNQYYTYTVLVLYLVRENTENYKHDILFYLDL